MPAARANGLPVSAAEGPEQLDTLQEAFRAHHASQCGVRTPGILTGLTGLRSAKADPTEDHVRDVLSGRLCRCTGCRMIVAACLGADPAVREARQVGGAARQ